MARILVVDDHPDGREFLATLLGYRGHTIELAADGEEAFRIIQAGPPDLVVSDILMPKVDGYELVRRMRSDPLLAATPVIFYTAGYDDEPARALAASAGVVQFLQKPAEPRTILNIIDAALGTKADPALPPPTPPEFGQQHLELLTSSLSQRVDELQREIAERVRAEETVIALNAALEKSNLELQAEIVEREHAQDQLLQVLKVESLGELTGGIAHDFNNLLTVILGSLDLMDKRNTDAKLIRLIDSAREATKRGARLTQQLLAFARKQRLSPTALDFGALLTQMFELLASTVGPNVQIHILPHRVTWRALADRNQIEMILMNLAANARDAMDGAGDLTISVAEASVHAGNRVEGLAPGEYVSIRVTDTGSGMTPEVMARAIEPFYTTKELGKGTGLGLSMVHGVTKQSGGTVVLESEHRRGTSVTIYLPRTVEGIVPAGLDAAVIGSNATVNKRVLLVDDDAQVRELTHELLLDLGYVVTLVDSGLDALNILRAGETVDLVVLDYAMPGMNGAEVARLARRHDPGLPILFVTGYASGLTLAEHESIPVLRKPYELGDFEAAIKGAFDGVRRTSQAASGSV